jgi:hypothetical protein
MAKEVKKGDYVKYSPDRGNENPNGKTILHGKVTTDYGDGTYQLTLNSGRVKDFVSEGNSLGMFKVIDKPKTKNEIPFDENDPYRPETETLDML